MIVTNLYDIQNDLVANSSASAWYVHHTPGAAADFRYRWSWWTSPADDEAGHQPDSHDSYAVHRTEPSLTMAWGLDAYPNERGARQYPWLPEDHYVNDTTHEYYVDFFWNGSLIDRVVVVLVDGGHAVLPLPSPAADGHVVSDFELAVALLLHDLAAGSLDDPAAHLQQLGIKRVRDDERHGAGASVSSGGSAD